MKEFFVLAFFYLNPLILFSQNYTLKIVTPDQKIIAYKIRIGVKSFNSDENGFIKIKRTFVSKNKLKKIALEFINSTDRLFYSESDFCSSIESDTLDLKNDIILKSGKDCNVSLNLVQVKDIFKFSHIELYFHNNRHAGNF